MDITYLERNPLFAIQHASRHTNRPLFFQGTIGEAEAMCRICVFQVMQNAESYHYIGISESRVISKRLRVADNEGSLVSVGPFGRSNTSTIDVAFDSSSGKGVELAADMLRRSLTRAVPEHFPKYFP